ncbi:MAG TPA: toprim domain-containing protein, partial [Candidatus Saccharibacteria bacterium]|nr:toprim domain-containing protein [Candidatus Saccharibacteria bacterium]
LDGIGPEQLHIQELVDRIKRDNVKEVIVATNASVEGETTALYIQEALKASDIALTRLARGLPIGVDLEYADQITLTRALQGRTAL